MARAGRAGQRALAGVRLKARPMHDHTLTSAPIDWDRYRLVIFDMDGTLYRQRPVQVAMAAKLLADALLTRRTTTLRTVRAFRHCRETLLDGSTDLARDQYAVSAGMLGTTAEAVRAVTERWIEQEPLGILGRHRLAGVAELFASLRERGKTIAILSDYPAAAKLAAELSGAPRKALYGQSGND